MPVLTLLLFASCTPVEFKTVSFREGPDSTSVTRSTGNILAGYPLSQQISLDAERRVMQDGTRKFFLLIEYYHESLLLKEWLNIDTFEPLVVRIDGLTVRLTGLPSRYLHEPIDGHPAETAVYEATPDLLQRMAGAHEVIVRIRAGGKTVERRFESENYQFLRRFVDEFCR